MLRALTRTSTSLQGAQQHLLETTLLSSFLQQRSLGDSGVPEYWGKPSPYTEGTEFLGTPKNHLELVAKRPVSPHVFEIDNKGFHYKMPWGAISSIANRVTGVGLTVGCAGAAYVALTGDLPGTLLALNTHYPALALPAKMMVSFPLIYHYAGGLRHIVWDWHKIGSQTDKGSLLETSKVETSSKLILGSSLALSVVASLL